MYIALCGDGRWWDGPNKSVESPARWICHTAHGKIIQDTFWSNVGGGLYHSAGAYVHTYFSTKKQAPFISLFFSFLLSPLTLTSKGYIYIYIFKGIDEATSRIARYIRPNIDNRRFRCRPGNPHPAECLVLSFLPFFVSSTHGFTSFIVFIFFSTAFRPLFTRPIEIWEKGSCENFTPLRLRAKKNNLIVHHDLIWWHPLECPSWIRKALLIIFLLPRVYTHWCHPYPAEFRLVHNISPPDWTTN